MALLLLVVGCSESPQEMPINSEAGSSTFRVETALSVTTRADQAATAPFYLYLKQGDVETFVKMKYDESQWKAYDVTDATEEPLYIVLGVSDVTAIAFSCGDIELTSEEFCSAHSYTIGGEELLYSRTDDSSITISDEGVITISFAQLLSRLVISLTGDKYDADTNYSVAASGLYTTINWCALDGGDMTPVETGSINAIEDDGSYICYIAPQSVSELSLTVTGGDQRRGYTVNSVKFISGESNSVSLK